MNAIEQHIATAIERAQAISPTHRAGTGGLGEYIGEYIGNIATGAGDVVVGVAEGNKTPCLRPGDCVAGWGCNNTGLCEKGYSEAVVALGPGAFCSTEEGSFTCAPPMECVDGFCALPSGGGGGGGGGGCKSAADCGAGESCIAGACKRVVGDEPSPAKPPPAAVPAAAEKKSNWWMWLLAGTAVVAGAWYLGKDGKKYPRKNPAYKENPAKRKSSDWDSSRLDRLIADLEADNDSKPTGYVDVTSGDRHPWTSRVVWERVPGGFNEDVGAVAHPEGRTGRGGDDPPPRKVSRVMVRSKDRMDGRRLWWLSKVVW